MAATSGSGRTITAGRGEAVPWRDSSSGIAVALRTPSSPRLAYFLSAFMRGYSSPPATLIEERQSVPLILAQRGSLAPLPSTKGERIGTWPPVDSTVEGLIETKTKFGEGRAYLCVCPSSQYLLSQATHLKSEPLSIRFDSAHESLWIHPSSIRG